MTTGFTQDDSTPTSGVLTISRTVTQSEIYSTYQPVINYPFSSFSGFGVKCNDRVICGGGQDSSFGRRKNVYHWQDNQFTEINSLNVRRSYCSSVYVPLNIRKRDWVLIVAGGFGEAGDTMEYLIMNDSFASQVWNVCKDKLPHPVESHQIDILDNKLILTGGIIDRQESADVWEGIISFDTELRVKWTPLPPMYAFRWGHVSVVIGDKLFCIGGYDVKSTEYFSFRINSWRKGPNLPFTLRGAKGVVNKSTNQCFILGGNHDSDESSSKVYLFDPINGLVDIQGEMNAGRFFPIAVLL